MLAVVGMSGRDVIRPLDDNARFAAFMNDDLLIAYGAACGFFARVLRPGLDADLLRQCARERVFQSWPLSGAKIDKPAGLAVVAGALADLGDDRLARIEEDNTALFIGPQDPVPMWESVWTTEERLLFADCTSAVQASFAEFGFQIANPANEPSDHLAFELAFMAALLARAGENIEAGDRDEAGRHLVAAEKFFEDHLARWAAECLRTITERASTDFYRGASLLCIDTLASLRANLANAQDIR
jgi:putative dimethyl sulfoxide reductase chaperone